MNLEQATISLIDQFPDGSHNDLQHQERHLERFGTVAFGGFVAIGGLGICFLLYTIAARMIFSGSQPLTGLLLAAFVIFAALSLAYVVWNETLKEKRQKIASSHEYILRPSIDGGPSHLIEEGHLGPAASVTEGTTRHLTHEKQTNKLN